MTLTPTPTLPTPIHCSHDWEVTTHLPSDSHAPRLCRRSVVNALNEYEMSGLADDSGLVATELMTNALQHGRGPLSFRLAWFAVRGRLRITVWDNGAGRAPTRAVAPPPDQENGRGLLIVAALTSDWGQYPTPCGGKALWAELGALGGGGAACVPC
jgi:anti-sigma regulatory factor (Ser/Thr protein kinase)